MTTVNEILEMRNVLKGGIMDKTFNRLKSVVGKSGDANIATIKALLGQTALIYNTFEGTILAQLAMLTYAKVVSDQGTGIDRSKKMDNLFLQYSQDTFNTRRLLLANVEMPKMSSDVSSGMGDFEKWNVSRDSEAIRAITRENYQLKIELATLRQEKRDVEIQVFKELTQKIIAAVTTRMGPSRVKELKNTLEAEFGAGAGESDKERTTSSMKGVVQDETHRRVNINDTSDARKEILDIYKILHD